MKILLSTSGTLGDILVLFPILAGIRSRYPDAHITLLNKHASHLAESPLNLVLQSGYADEICIVSAFQLKIRQYISLFPYPGRRKYDEVFFLQRDGNSLQKKIRRELPFLQRISRNPVRGACELETFADPRQSYPQIMEFLLKRINHDNPEPITPGSPYLPLNPMEINEAQKLLDSLQMPAGAVPFIVCVGGKKAVSRWPRANYTALLRKIIRETPAVPIFVGGKSDREEIQLLLNELPQGKAFYLPELSSDLRKSIALMSRCAFYLGNDTGSIHMAAAAHLRCIGIYSGHAPNGLWNPLGEGHRIFREIPAPECVGCRKTDCPHGFPAPCMAAIAPEEIFHAVEEMVKTATR